MLPKFEYNGRELLDSQGSYPGLTYLPVPLEEFAKINLIKVKNLALNEFKNIVEQNEITIQMIKNSSLSSISITHFLIKNEMFDHLEFLVNKFGCEILNCGSLSYEEGSLGEGCWDVYQTLWDAAFTHDSKPNFQKIIKKLIDLKANINLCTFSCYDCIGNYRGMTLLDKIITKINNRYITSCEHEKFKSIAIMLINEGAECNTSNAWISSLLINREQKACRESDSNFPM